MRQTALHSLPPSELSSTQEKLQPRSEVYQQVINITGGRLAFLSKVARAPDMLEAARQLMDNEKSWLLDHIGLIPDHDDDVMDEVSLPTVI
jgi:hypothetical protein